MLNDPSYRESPRARASRTAFGLDSRWARAGSAVTLLFSLGCSSGGRESDQQQGAQGGSGGNAGAISSPSGAAGATGGSAGGGSDASGAGSGGAAASGGATSAGAGGSDNPGGGSAGGSVGAAGANGVGEQKSAGCGKPRTLQDGKHMVQSGGTQRSYALSVPNDYDDNHAYRLMLGFHGATDSSANVAPSYFGLRELSAGSTIFAAPDAVSGLWNADTDTKMVEDLLAQLKAELCIDTSRIEIEGFSMGGAMAWTLACALPGTFRLAIVHSGGGLALPKTCEPIPFLSSLGHDGSGQGMSSDFFAMTNGCSAEILPAAPSGGHACTDYEGCTANHPTRWCAYDGGHTPAPTDSGQSKSWMPQEVWNFVKQF